MRYEFLGFKHTRVPVHFEYSVHGSENAGASFSTLGSWEGDKCKVEIDLINETSCFFQ